MAKKGKVKKRNDRDKINLKVSKSVLEKDPNIKLLKTDIYDDELLTIRWLPTADGAVLMYREQETVEEWRAEYLLQTWKPSRFRIPIVVQFTKGPLKGQYMIVVGHHRYLSIKEMGEELFPCFVKSVTCMDEVAEIFNDDADNDADSRKTLLECWPSLLREKIPYAVDLQEIIVNKYKFILDSNKGNNKVTPIVTIRSTYRKYNEKRMGLGKLIFDESFHILREVYDGEASSLLSDVIIGLATAFGELDRSNFKPDYSWLIHKMRMKKITSQDIRDGIKNNSKGHDYQKRAEDYFRGIYNSRKKTDMWP